MSNTYTEAEAAGKWCPMVRMVTGDNRCFEVADPSAVEIVGRNRAQDPNTLHADCTCIGSRCMAWRWTITPAEVLSPLYTGDPACGRCGLADE